MPENATIPAVAQLSPKMRGWKPVVLMRIKTGEEGGAGHDATRQQASKQISDYSDADMISWFLHH